MISGRERRLAFDGGNEESLVILRGSGVANVEVHADIPFRENMLVYIPLGTKHNITNTGKVSLEYVWVVAPANQRPSANPE